MDDASPIVAPTSVIILVVDEQLGTPIPDAQVRLEGDRVAYDALSADDGIAQLTAVERGAYLATVSQYEYVFSSQVVKCGSSNLTIKFSGRRVRPRLIAGVEAHQDDAARTRLSNDSSHFDDLASRAANSSLDALGRSASVNLWPSGGLSVRGSNALETAETINGAQLIPTGFPGAVHALSSDGFDNAKLDVNPLSGSPNGSIGLATFDPTLDWKGLAEQRESSNQDQSLTLLERGTSGRIGLSVAIETTSETALGNGQRYVDASGYDYLHKYASTNFTGTSTIRVPVSGSQALFFDSGVIDRVEPTSCSFEDGSLPCGYGPNNSSTTNLRFVQIRDSLFLTHWTLDSHVFGSISDVASESSSAGSLVSPQIQTSNENDRRYGFLERAQSSGASGQTLTLQDSLFVDQTGQAGSLVVATPTLYGRVSHDVSASLALPLNERLRGTVSAGFNSIGAYSAPKGSVQLDLRPTSRDVISVAGAAGTLATPIRSSAAFEIPADLVLDCASNQALGTGTFQRPPSSPVTSTFSATETHSQANWSGSIQLYDNIETPGLVSAAVPLAFEPAGSLTKTSGPGFGFPLAILCPSYVTGAANTFLTNTGYASRVVRDGADFTVNARVDRRIRVSTEFLQSYAHAYGFLGNVAQGIDAQNGAQMSGIPVNTISASLAYHADSRLDAYVDLKRFSGNNEFSQSPLTTVNAALRVSGDRTSLVVAAENALNAGAPAEYGRFAPFPFLSTPYSARSVSARVRLLLGEGAVDRTPFLSQPVSLGGALSFAPRALEGEPPGTALQVDRTSPACGPEEAPAAKTVLDAVGAFATGTPSYRARIEQTLNDGIKLERLPDGTVKISLPNNRIVLAAVFRCSKLHEGTVDQASALGLYMPDFRQRVQDGALALYYAPQIGLYFAPDPIDRDQVDSQAPSPFPDHRRFAEINVVTKDCPASFVRTVEADAQRIKAAILVSQYGAIPILAPRGFTFAAHRYRDGTWLEIRSEDDGINDAIARCLGVPLASQADLKKFGLTGAVYPSINFAKEVGFFRFSGQ